MSTEGPDVAVMADERIVLDSMFSAEEITFDSGLAIEGDQAAEGAAWSSIKIRMGESVWLELSVPADSVYPAQPITVSVSSSLSSAWQSELDELLQIGQSTAIAQADMKEPATFEVYTAVKEKYDSFSWSLRDDEVEGLFDAAEAAGEPAGEEPEMPMLEDEPGETEAIVWDVMEQVANDMDRLDELMDKDVIIEEVVPDQFTLGEMWQNLPEEHILREKALALMMGTHPRLGRASRLAGLDEHVLQLVATFPLDHPLVVPDEYESLSAAIQDAVGGQKIIIKKGTYSLVRGVSSPTRVDRYLEIIAEDGVKLIGGLQLGMDSGGLLQNVEIEGHLWIYGGKWRVQDCTVRNKRDAAFVISNEARVRVYECFVGGWRSRHASHGWIIYGSSQVEIEACDVQYCTIAATFGGGCTVVFRESDFKDNTFGFGVLHPGGHGKLISVQDCELLRARRMWVDHHRPLRVRGASNVVHSDSFTEGYQVGELGEVLQEPQQQPAAETAQ